ncbi:DUF1929 domain-containing protein [Alphaproteobacteria bacterium]|nr:DUF1929 domain-containing protein [Alphaproteobacteria bacterium]
MWHNYKVIIRFVFKFFYRSFVVVSLSFLVCYVLVSIYRDRQNYIHLLEQRMGHISPIFRVNTVEKSDKQVPPISITDLEIIADADKLGMWSAPFDWPVIGLHSILLPDYKVMTYGSYGVKSMDENKDIREDKEIVLTNDRHMMRDAGDNQWAHHDIFAGVDFDIWDPNLGVQDNSHNTIHRPVVLDAFCSVVKVINMNEVFILGGNIEPDKMHTLKQRAPDNQNKTTLYDVSSQSFKSSHNMRYERWYGSLIRTGDNKLIIVGGEDQHPVEGVSPYSITPEILDLNDPAEYYWKELNDATSNKFFGAELYDEWSYPKTYLASDGNIFGISYNQLWLMEKNNNYSIKKVGEIPLVSGGITNNLIHNNANNGVMHEKNLQLLTIGASVGSTASSLMIDKDKIIMIGGKQNGKEYSPSNHTNLIDISNSSDPKITKLKSMHYPRSNLNATILPNGEIFVNGGTSFEEHEFSVLMPEIYNIKQNKWKTLTPAHFRRNYHAATLLLPNGTLLITGGDIWTAEIYYPPYLFAKNWDGKLELAKRPKIINMPNKIIVRDEITIESSDTSEIAMISLLSTGSTTHAQASDSKFRSLDFQQVDDKFIKLSIPVNKNEIQDGTYLLFLINKMGTPSLGKIISLENTKN